MDKLPAAILRPTFLMRNSSVPTHINVNIVGLSYFCEEFVIKYNSPVFL